MREIKFRGKRVDNGEWVYGSVNYRECGEVIIHVNNKLLPYNAKIVIPETVGQFTGLLDKNGVEIYEGDIIKLDDIDCVITFDDGCFQMVMNKEQGKSGAIQERVKRFEVIKNIHENE